MLKTVSKFILIAAFALAIFAPAAHATGNLNHFCVSEDGTFGFDLVPQSNPDFNLGNPATWFITAESTVWRPVHFVIDILKNGEPHGHLVTTTESMFSPGEVISPIDDWWPQSYTPTEQANYDICAGAYVSYEGTNIVYCCIQSVSHCPSGARHGGCSNPTPTPTPTATPCPTATSAPKPCNPILKDPGKITFKLGPDVYKTYGRIDSSGFNLAFDNVNYKLTNGASTLYTASFPLTPTSSRQNVWKAQGPGYKIGMSCSRVRNLCRFRITDTRYELQPFDPSMNVLIEIGNECFYLDPNWMPMFRDKGWYFDN